MQPNTAIITPIIALLLLLSGTPSVLSAQENIKQPEWEYQVVFLAGTAAGSKTETMTGDVVDLDKTETLNRLAKEGWEVISVTGASGADHAVYMRRARQ